MENTDMLSKMTGKMNAFMAGAQNLNEVEAVEIATAEREIVWQDGKVKLYHFKNENVSCKTPVVISYALVNRWMMMDLQPDRSFIRKLLSEGMDVYLIDSGYPTASDRYKNMDDYINGNIDDIIDFVRDRHKLDKINLLGVCQGGTFSLIYTALHPEKIKNLITMITPADFDIEDGLLFQWSREMDVDNIVDSFDGIVPGQFLDMGFQLLKPMSKMRKYMNLPSMMEDKGKFMNYLRMEKWVNDCPDQAGEIYRQFIKEMYQQNKLIKGEFELGGQKVDLKTITMPIMNIYAKDDHIVPPAASIPINDVVGSKDKELFEFPGGHIGVYVGSRSQKMLAPAVAEFLKKRDK